MRMQRETYFMKIAELTAERGTCNKLKVGAVLTKNNRVIALGYNGAPSGFGHCEEIGCLEIDNHCKRALHAEGNLVTFCARQGIRTKGSALYSTHRPCSDCLKLLIAARVTQVLYKEDYKNVEADVLVEEAERKGIISINKVDGAV